MYGILYTYYKKQEKEKQIPVINSESCFEGMNKFPA
jgi:hypothetical protein